MKKIIYLADYDKNICNLIESVLEKDGYVVKSFNEGSSLLDEFYLKPADLVILDMMLPGINGLTTCAILRKLSPVPIIMISKVTNEIDKITALNLGCDDYITKPFSALELISRINALFRRIELDQATYTLRTTLKFEDLVIDEKKRTATINNKNIKFTPTELSLMIYLIKHSNRAVSREELLRKVWKFNSDTIDTRATDDTVKRLRKKLLSYDSNVTIQTLRGYGFCIIKNR